MFPKILKIATLWMDACIPDLENGTNDFRDILQGARERYSRHVDKKLKRKRYVLSNELYLKSFDYVTTRLH